MNPTADHRARQLLLRRSTVADLERLWPLLRWDQLDSTYPLFAAAVGTLVARNRATSAGLAMTYLRAMRAVHVPGWSAVDVRSAVDPAQLDTSLRVNSVVAAKKSAARAVPAAEAMSAALSLTQGAMARLVLNGGRETVAATVAADPRASGWRRVLGGGGCDFCRMLAGRGSVYSQTTSHFESHDHCGCTAEPVYE